MNSLNLSQTKEILEKNNLSPLKKLGQNFLIDSNIIENIVDSMPVDKSSNVIEIGPGLGALTCKLAQKVKKVVSIDIDSGMIRILSEMFSAQENVSIVHADILKIDLNEIAETYFNNEAFHVCGNLPYYITAKCLLKICESNARSMTCMIQKEVAERIVSGPGTKNYGVLTASLAYYTKPSTVFTVSKNCFYPIPDVESAVIYAELGTPLLDGERTGYIRTVKSCFAQRRKTIFNNLAASYKELSKEKIKTILVKLMIPENERAENIPPEKFAELSRLL